MALTKISGNVVQQNNFSLSGVVTATSFTGDLTGNVTGTATTATNLADGANITTGTISNDRLPSTITKNLTGDVTGNLTGNVSSSGANTLGSLSVTNDATVGGALTVTGDLTVNGTTTTIDTAVTAVDSLSIDGNAIIDGSVGIGTDNPTNKLHVQNGAIVKDQYSDQNSANPGLQLKHNGTIYGSWRHDGRLEIGGQDSDAVIRLNPDGTVGIGTDNPGAYFSDANDIVLQKTDDCGITIASGTSQKGTVAFADGTTGDQAYRGYIQYNHSTDSLQVATSGTEALRITSTGNIGIGTDTPIGKLHLNYNGNNGISFRMENFEGYSSFHNDGGALYIDSGQHIFRNEDGSSETLRISSTGNLGIGENNPAAKLDVKGSLSNTVDIRLRNTESNAQMSLYAFGGSAAIGSHFNNRIAMMSWSSTEGIDIITNGTGNNDFRVYTAGYGTNSERFRITSGGKLGVNTTALDAQLEVNSTASRINTVTIKTSAGAGGYAGLAFMAGQTSAGREKAAIYFQETNNGAHYTGDIVFALNNDSGSAVQVGTSDERLRITSSGNVAIGHNSPRQTLDVSGDIRIKDARSLFFKRFGDNYAWRIRNESAANGSDGGYTGSNTLLFEVVTDSSVQATPSTTSHSIYGSSVNTLALKESGRVGIGTDNPNSKLHIIGGNLQVGDFSIDAETKLSNNILTFKRNGDSYIDQLGNGLIHFRLGASQSSVLKLQDSAEAVKVIGETALTGTTGGAKGLTLQTSGGYSCPLYFGSETHSAQKSMYLSGYWIYLRGHQNEGIRFIFSQPAGSAPRSDQYEFKYNAAYRPTGNTTWDGFSDRRAKENIQDVTSALDTIGRLRPVTFDWTNDYADRMNMFNFDKTDTRSYMWTSVKENGYDETRKNNNVGFIAQEFEEVFPNDITETEMQLGDETISDFKTVNFDSLIPMLTKAVQELKAENDSLRARLDAAGL